MKVKLIDGPYKGTELEVFGTGSVHIDPSDETRVHSRQALYQPSRDQGEYRFKGWVGQGEVFKIPVPESPGAPA